MRNDRAAITGRVWIEDGFIKNRSTLFGDWQIPIADVRLIGEATNEDGPFLDDWMLIFARDVGEWFEASAFAPGILDFREELGRTIGRELIPQLAASTTFDSRVLWPMELQGRPVFNYDDTSPKALGGQLGRKIFGPTGKVQTFSDEVRQLLQSKR